MKSLALLGSDALNWRTMPSCWTTNHRELSFGACSSPTGTLNVRLVNRDSEMEPVLEGRGHATHVAFAGR
jgi:hypothetical protein